LERTFENTLTRALRTAGIAVAWHCVLQFRGGWRVFPDLLVERTLPVELRAIMVPDGMHRLQ
ncbi:MAG TPA: hypothetical protein VIG49_13580, partial [Acetobacteraceae bacterium]